MHAVSGHILFPYCLGFIKPNLTVDGCNINNMRNDDIKKLCKYEWILVCCQVVQGIQLLHGMNVLHNDIKSNNIIVVEAKKETISTKAGQLSFCRYQHFP